MPISPHFSRCLFLSGMLLLWHAFSCAKETPPEAIPGAHRIAFYKPLLEGKRVALLLNHTATVHTALLPDTLLKSGVRIVKLFVPEHGFRGTADAGEYVKDGTDPRTGLPVVSLYGKNKKPASSQLADVDVVIYDIQDVGVRFYTYISSLQYMMEACAENGIPLIVLDRPNPNGHYVDGPVLEPGQRSFVGMQQVPVVYGMTVGEYAHMLAGERLFPHAEKLQLEVISCLQYTHHSTYHLPVPPSPNLQTMHAVYQYPSLCLFEGTVVSLGRGTDHPFEQWGHPAFKSHSGYYFIPQSRTGSTNPPYKNEKCYGERMPDSGLLPQHIDLVPLIKAYRWYPEKQKFFIPFFEKLSGTGELRRQILQGKSPEEIRESWQPGIRRFKEVRKKYLLYPDFE